MHSLDVSLILRTFVQLIRIKMNRIVSFSLVIYFFLIFAENKAGESRVCGTDARCTCFRDKENVTAICRMSDLGSISQSFSIPAGVNSL